MRKKTVFRKGLTALVISSMLVTVPTVSHVAFADNTGVDTVTETTSKTEEETLPASSEAEETEAENENPSETDETENTTETSAESEETEEAGEAASATEKAEELTEASTEADKKADETEATGDAAATIGSAAKANAAEITAAETTAAETETDKEASAAFEANIKALKFYESKLDSLTTEDAEAIQKLMDAVSEYYDANEASISDEDKAFLTGFAEKFNNASIKTAAETKTINEQINAATSAATITVSEDTEEDVVIPSGKDITLKINDGITLTNVKDHTVTVKKGGTLTIESDGTIDNVTHAKAALEVEPGGTATIKSGEFDRSEENGVKEAGAGGNSYYIIENHGKLTIEDAEVSSEGSFSSLVHNGYQNQGQNTAKNEPELTIKGGTFSGGINTIKNDDNGIVEITGGDFCNMTQYALLNWNEATISGGTFSLADGVEDGFAVHNLYAASYDAGKMTITGGTFAAPIYTNKGSTLKITEADAINAVYASAGATLTLPNDGPQKDGYKFLGWFKQKDDAGNEKKFTVGSPDGTETGVYMYKPAYLQVKASVDTETGKADVKDEDKTTSTISANVQQLVESIISNESQAEDSKVKFEVASDSNIEKLQNTLTDAAINGIPIEAKVVIANADENDITSEQKDAITKEVGNKTLGQYVDIDINLLVGSDKVANITQLKDKIEIVMELPEKLQASNRNYTVIRLHDNEATALDTSIADSKHIKFSSDKFSLYAIAYEDVKDDSKDESKADDTNKDSSTTDNSSKDNGTTNKTTCTGSGSHGGSGSSGSSVNAVAVNNGSWQQDSTGWWFKKSDGSYPKDAWYECIWNGSKNWYHFNAQGYADGGWLTDEDGQKYYLHNVHDGRFGYMYTGWNQIADKWYFFNIGSDGTGPAASGLSKGALVTNTTTADGYKVGADGAWIQ